MPRIGSIGGMPRSLRIEFPGAFYHITARGYRDQTVFHDEEDYQFFLKALGDACARTGWRVHAWVVTGNHYHLFLETPGANLVSAMALLQNLLTRRFNARHRPSGRVFGDRYKSVLVQGKNRGYYQALMDYIHLDPVRARLVRPGQGSSLRHYPWSSLAAGYALPKSKRPKWLEAEVGLAAFDCLDTVAGRRQMVERLDQRAQGETFKSCGVPVLPEGVDGRCSRLGRGWYWGTPAFGERMKKVAERVVKRKPPGSSGPRLKRPDKKQLILEAEAWLMEGMKAAALRASRLSALKGSDPRKVLLAERLFRDTVVSQAWIAKKLRMKSAANVSQQIRRLDVKEAMKRVPPELRAFLEK